MPCGVTGAKSIIAFQLDRYVVSSGRSDCPALATGIPESEHAMPTLPDDIQRLVDAMNAADTAAEELSSPLSDEDFFWRPDGGTRWSVALCLDHLAVANDVYSRAIEGGIDAARSRGLRRQAPLMPGFLGRKFAESLEPPVKRRTSAPGKIKPQGTRSRAEIMTAYRAAHDRIRALLVQAADVDVNRATFKNPFIGFVRMKASSAFHVIAAHDRRHLWQAQQVVAARRAQAGR